MYDALVKGELTAYLADSVGAFDLVVSADTLVYFGALEAVVGAAAAAMRPGGRLIFTVEESGESYVITVSTRMGATPTRGRMSSVCSRTRGSGPRSRTCAPRAACRWPGWWCERRSVPVRG